MSAGQGDAVASREDGDREAAVPLAPARRIAERVLSCPDVAGLSRGPFGAVATYLPGDLVPGVAVRDDVIEVHVVARYGRPLPEVAELIRDAIGDLAAGRRMDVAIAGLVTSDGRK
ncbi:hypothetical protein [Microbispora triticiradicis]|uniref:hypothetical protein n=1 Tax=Microbispora triticiradicis TaxID=2200763 RepID=UPI0027DB5E77|nr:hypothetical protein [Microbispora triticiradicis]